MSVSRVIDPRSTANATLTVTERTDLLVVGGGPAGLAAAIAAARHGLAVVLVDENPVAAETMGDDVPLHFGQRMSGVVRNRSAMTEAMLASEPALADAFECGVDVRLGVIVWGLYTNGPSVGWLPGRVAGLSDGATSWMLGFKAAIVATGRRDMGLAFPGWEKPGVMGATAAERLVGRYAALDARRAVVLGSGAEALLAALAMRRAGVEVAAIVEQASEPIGPAALLSDLAAAGVPLLTRHVIAAAEGDADGVVAAVLTELDGEGRRIPGSRTSIACDTIVLGIAAVPVIELLDALGCRIAFAPERGGHVPITDAAHMTSLPGIYAIGDCAGVWAAKSADRAVAVAEGRRAARHAAARIADEALPPEHGPAGIPRTDLPADRAVAVAEGRRAARHAAARIADEALPPEHGPAGVPRTDLSADRVVAEAEDRRAARLAAALVVDETLSPEHDLAAPPSPCTDLSSYRLAWVRAAVIGAGDASSSPEAHVCQCEEVTAREILEVRPPRYLQWERPPRNSADLSALLGNGAPNPDQVKRLTRAGMGLCQGRRCREQVAALLALAAGVGLADVPLATHRAPVRPLALGVAGSLPESAAMAEHWDVWFGIPGQVASPWEIPPVPAPHSGPDA